MNMLDRMRLYATMFIWIAFMVMTIVLFTSDTGRINNYDIIPILGILAGTAFLSTTAVWIRAGRSGGSQAASQVSSQTSAQPSAWTEANYSKRKRVQPNILERLVEGLDDDELDELEALLFARDEMDEPRRYQR